MRRRHNVALQLLMLGTITLDGCTSLQPLLSAERAAIAEQIRDGDRIRVIDRSGTRLELRVVRVAQGVIEGTSGKDIVHVALEDIARIERHEPAPGRTAALGASLAALWLAIEAGEAYAEAYNALWAPPSF